MKVHAIAYFELKRLALVIGIAFLSCLDSFQIGLDAMDYLFSFNDKVRAKRSSFRHARSSLWVYDNNDHIKLRKVLS
jgi:hypothetical protein